MEIRDLADELQAILDGERPRLNKAEMREYLECLRAFAPIAAQDEAVLEIGECAEVIWHQGGPCQLPPGAKLYLHAERARVPDGVRETIMAVLSALDKSTGDSDPNIGPDMTDEEVRDEYPDVWAMQQLTGLLAAAPPQPEDAA